jgi:hypothetical protein
MSTPSLLRGDTSGGSVRKVGDSLATLKDLISQWLWGRG